MGTASPPEQTEAKLGLDAFVHVFLDYVCLPDGSLFSQYLDDKAWIEENFPKDMRYETVIIHGPNVLTADYFTYVSQKSELPYESKKLAIFSYAPFIPNS